MFFTSPIPAPQQVRDWNVPQQPGMAPLAQLLEEARQTNGLLKAILGAILSDGLPDKPDPATKPEDLSFDPLSPIERVEWLSSAHPSPSARNTNQPSQNHAPRDRERDPKADQLQHG